jgi:hypothetical protein
MANSSSGLQPQLKSRLNIMPNDCIDLSAVQNFAAKDVNRIVGQIAKVLARKSPFMSVLKGGTIPNVSDVVRSIVQERAVMNASLAEPEFTNDVELCGTGADPDEVGSTEYQYQLQSLRGRGPRVCIKTSRTAFKGAYLQAQMALEKGILQIMNSDIRATLMRRSGVKFVAKKGTSFDTIVTGDSQQIDTPFYASLPDSQMNFRTLYKLGTLLREDLLAEPFGTANGDFFMVITSIDQAEAFRNDADVKEDLLAVTAGSFKLGEEAITGYTFKGYRGFAFGIDSQPLRFNVLDGTGQPVLIEPEIGVSVTNGKGARRNPAWISAKCEIGFLVAGESFSRLTPERYTGEGSFKFAPQLHMGELEWVAQRDNDCNLFLDYGQHIYQISRAYQPVRPHCVVPFAYQRCTFDTGLEACLSSANGL